MNKPDVDGEPHICQDSLIWCNWFLIHLGVGRNGVACFSKDGTHTSTKKAALGLKRPFRYVEDDLIHAASNAIRYRWWASYNHLPESLVIDFLIYHKFLVISASAFRRRRRWIDGLEGMMQLVTRARGFSLISASNEGLQEYIYRLAYRLKDWWNAFHSCDPTISIPRLWNILAA